MPGTFGTTTRNALRWLKGTSLVSDVDEGFQALAEDVDTKMASYSQGTLAARPAAGQANRFYKTTDTGVIYHDTGAAWEPIMPFLALRVATGVTAVSGDYIISGTGTTTLPTAAANSLVTVSAEAAAAVKVLAAGAAKIYGPGVEGVASINLTGGQSVTLFATGTNWFIIAGEPKREEAQKPKTLTSGKAEEFSAVRPAFVRVQAKAGESITALLQHTEGLATAPPVGAVVTLFVQAGETITVSTSGGLAANAWYILL